MKDKIAEVIKRWENDFRVKTPKWDTHKYLSVAILDLIAKELSEEEVSGALARGYCHKGCERYVMNPTLVMAMTKEVLALLDIKHKLEVEK